ncbi:uncharacterized protein LY89DRAFT_742703 [Mollisia scopiformis]|uniref:BTB domain-containing protein n=1 Tax=Mollisia scopiformis TaxID=149040 RepID=A0A132B556_MOLSC|nr:uncharacterized protein LY89DRAFT_742703 [Mollisia scopiformis]KUJ07471.1 hypothetical protein LY89DRAFT_742703 [Mollisia scopiformis]
MEQIRHFMGSALEASTADAKRSIDKSLAFRGPQTFVKIHIGPGNKKESFMLQKSLICFHSPVFDRAFNGSFLEGQTQEMTMEDVEVEIFHLLVTWMYCGEIREVLDRNMAINMAKLWVLAGRFLIPKLQNQAIKHIGNPDYLGSAITIGTISVHKGTLARQIVGEFVQYVANEVDPESPLYRYCVRTILSNCILEMGSTSQEKVSKGRLQIGLALEEVMGKSMMTDLVKSLMETLEGQIKDIKLTALDMESYFVLET